ncbi:MAG: PAS domain S-box protein [Candidatus Aminicenantes bacterium]|nr:PAS domain S-box protein [Candidatus Aminicenantes bacterium]
MTEKPETEKLIRIDQVMQLYSSLPIGAGITLLVATVLLIAQWPVIPHPVLLSWWGFMITVTIARLLLWRSYCRSIPPRTDIETWAKRFFTGTVFSGLTWGSSGLLLFPEQEPVHQLVLILVITGMSSAAVTTLSAVWEDITVFLCLMLMPIITRFFLFGDGPSLVMGALTMLYLAGLLLAARRMYNTIQEALKLRVSELRHETELLESEEKYRTVVERSNDGIVIIQDGVIIYVNKRMEEINGYSTEELTGATFAAYLAPEEVPIITERYKKRLAGEDVPPVYETVAIHKEGKRVDIEVNVGTIFFHHKTSEIAIVRDITERKKTEAALRESEDRYRALFNHASDYIFIIDPTHRDGPVIADVNEYACTKHGYTREELLDKPYSIVDDVDSQQEITGKTQRILAGEILNYDSVHVRKDGSKFPVEVAARLIVVKEKPVVIAIVRDSTERKHAEALIKKALAEKEVLLKEIHHRVKNNLQVITSLLSLQSRYIKDENALDVLRSSRERVWAMASVHEELYSSKSLSKVDFPAYIPRLANHLFDTYSLSRDRVRLEMEIDDINLDVESAIPIGLIINELVSNSLKYAFPGSRNGEVKVQLSRTKNGDHDYILVVRDNGVGLPGNFSIEQNDSLGMVLVKTLVRQMHGVLDCDTDDGAVFTIKFKGSKSKK